MPTPLVITLSARNDELRHEIEQQIAPYGEVHSAPPSFDLEQVKLIVEIISGATGVVANGAAIMTFLLMLKDRGKQQGQPTGVQVGQMGGRSVPLEDADDALLRNLLGIDEEAA